MFNIQHHYLKINQRILFSFKYFSSALCCLFNNALYTFLSHCREFDVDSLNFPGQVHKWRLTQLLQKGSLRAHNTLLDVRATMELLYFYWIRILLVLDFVNLLLVVIADNTHRISLRSMLWIFTCITGCSHISTTDDHHS